MVVCYEVMIGKPEGMKQMAKKTIAAAAIAGAMAFTAWSADVSANDAKSVATGWAALKEMVGERVSGTPASIEEVAGCDGLGTLYIVNFSGGGWALVAGDTAMNPIIAYNAEGSLSATDDHPLLALAKGDAARVAAIRKAQASASQTGRAGAGAAADAIPANPAWARYAAAAKQTGRAGAGGYGTEAAGTDVTYSRLEYLFVNSNTVFKTSYQTAAGDEVQVDVLFEPDRDENKTASMVPFFSRESTSANLLTMWYWRENSTSSGSRGKLRFDYASSGNSAAAAPAPAIAGNVKYRFTLESGAASAVNLDDGTRLTLNNTSFTSGTAAGQYMWLLGGTSGNTSTQEGEGGALAYCCTETRFYDFRVVNGGAVKCHYVPAVRNSDGVVGVLDIMSGAFIEPTLGDGAEVTAGPVAKPSFFKGASSSEKITARVTPLLKTAWNQGGACNLYTPNNYVCGCVPLSMAQVMAYFRWPVTEGDDAFAVDTTTEFSVTVDGEAYTGDNPPRTLYGHYYWDLMSDLKSSADTTTEAAYAIGKLVHDAGFALGVNYNSSGTGTWDQRIASRLTTWFNYSGAKMVNYDTSAEAYIPTLQYYMNSIKASLDAKLPVEIGVPGHSIVADGYGYTADENRDFYVHIISGWGDYGIGYGNGWYNISESAVNIDFSTMTAREIPDYTAIQTLNYDIFTNGYDNTYTIVSGRITNNVDGAAMAGVTVHAIYGGKTNDTAVTDANGVYALRCPTSALTMNGTFVTALNTRQYKLQAVAPGCKTATTGNIAVTRRADEQGLFGTQVGKATWELQMTSVPDQDIGIDYVYAAPEVFTDTGIRAFAEGQRLTLTLVAPDADEIKARTGADAVIYYSFDDSVAPADFTSSVASGGTIQTPENASGVFTLRCYTYAEGSGCTYVNTTTRDVKSVAFFAADPEGNLIANGDFELSASSKGGIRGGAADYSNPWWIVTNDNTIVAKPVNGSTWVQKIAQFGNSAAVLQTSAARLSATLEHEPFYVPAADDYRFSFDYAARLRSAGGDFTGATTSFRIIDASGNQVYSGSVVGEDTSVHAYLGVVTLSAGAYTLVFEQGQYEDPDNAGTYLDKGNVFDNISVKVVDPAPAPVIAGEDGANNFFADSTKAIITSEIAEATIYYTTDGTDPTTSSAVYSGGIAITADTTVKAIVAASGYKSSAIATATFAKTDILGENLVKGATAIGGENAAATTAFAVHSPAKYDISFTYAGTSGDTAEVVATAADGTSQVVATVTAGAEAGTWSGQFDAPAEGAYTLSLRAQGGGATTVALGDLAVLLADNTINTKKFWIVENKTARSATGSWSPAMEYANGRIAFEDATAYTATRAAMTSYATIRTKMNFVAYNATGDTEAPSADTKAAMRIGDVSGSFELYTMVDGSPAWVAVAAEGVTPSPSTDYSLVFRLNTLSKTYTAAVLDAEGNEIPFKNGTQTSFPFACDSSSAVQTVTFDCSGTVESIYGSDKLERKGVLIKVR